MTPLEMLLVFKEEYNRIQPSTPNQFYTKTTKCPSMYKMKKTFNADWDGLLKLIGINNTNVQFKRRTREEYIDILLDVAKKLGHSPSVSEFNMSLSNKPFHLLI